jgi:hypothetical protein
MLAVLGAVVVMPAAARTDRDVRAEIPFEFVAGGLTLPAGTYEFTQAGGEQVIRITDANGVRKAALVVSPVYHVRGQSATAGLIFNKYGQQYFLNQVWGAGAVTGVRLPQTKREREAVRTAVARSTMIAAN